VELPLAYYVPPVSRTPGELRVSLDFEQTRLTFTDGLCSLRLRRPCEWEGALYESVTAVAPVQLLSGAGGVGWMCGKRLAVPC
jgi:hypothetical protein